MAVETFERTVLPNGIRIISERIETVRSVALGFWVLAGSVHETRETNGLAHFFEHMVFKGTRRRSAFEIAHAIESLGGSINAFTGKHITCFYVRLMAEHLHVGADVLADLILHPRLNPNDIKREKGVILEEIKEVEDTPGDLIHDLFAEQIFPDHPLGTPIQGTAASVARLTRQDLRQFTDRHYTADRLIVAASGNIDHSLLVQLVGEGLGHLKRNPDGIPYDPVPAIRETAKIHQRPVSQSHLVMGRRIFGQGDIRRFALSLYNILLSGGMSARLFQNIRERYGYVYAIYSFAELFLDNGYFGIYAGVDQQQLDTIRSLIQKELEKLAMTPVSESELRALKEQFKGGLVISLEGMQSRMNRLAKMEIYDETVLTIDDILAHIEAIDAGELLNFARYICEQEEVSTMIVPSVQKAAQA